MGRASGGTKFPSCSGNGSLFFGEKVDGRLGRSEDVAAEAAASLQLLLLRRLRPDGIHNGRNPPQERPPEEEV